MFAQNIFIVCLLLGHAKSKEVKADNNATKEDT